MYSVREVVFGNQGFVSAVVRGRGTYELLRALLIEDCSYIELEIKRRLLTGRSCGSAPTSSLASYSIAGILGTELE